MLPLISLTHAVLVSTTMFLATTTWTHSSLAVFPSRTLLMRPLGQAQFPTPGLLLPALWPLLLPSLLLSETSTSMKPMSLLSLALCQITYPSPPLSRHSLGLLWPFGMHTALMAPSPMISLPSMPLTGPFQPLSISSFPPRFPQFNFQSISLPHPATQTPSSPLLFPMMRTPLWTPQTLLMRSHAFQL